MPRLNQRMKLPDGRVLGYHQYGPLDGKPIFHFHGTPSARVEWPLFGSEALAQALKLRVIVPDRPGLGLSDFQPNRRLSDWPGDAAALADHLGLERFAIIGLSCGGPYALACALAMPQRLTRVGIVSGPAPFDQPGLTDGLSVNNRQFWDLVRRRPWLAGLMLSLMSLMAKFAGEAMVANALASLPEPDRRAVLARQELQQGFLHMLREALRQGPRGARHDAHLIASPWDFRLGEINIPVQLWHGEADENAPAAMGRYVAEAMPNSSLQLYPGEGHLSLFARHADDILRVLAN